MEIEVLQKIIKESFCGLTKFKVRDNILEIITPLSTLNNKFVSVFIKFEKQDFIITDGGWIDYNLYEYSAFEESEDLISRLRGQYLSNYDIKITTDKQGKNYYYKKTSNYKQLTIFIYDLANFAVGIINSHSLQFKDPKEETQREDFRKNVNTFLKDYYSDKVKFKAALDDFKNIKYNAIITPNSTDIYLLSYVTGSTPYYFENDLRRSIVNFEIAEKSKYRGYIKEKITIINNECDGYNTTKSGSILSLLEEKATQAPIIWADRNKLLSIIINN